MIDQHAIAALTALARSTSLDESLPLLEVVRRTLGDDADRFQPLLETLTMRVQEITEMKRQMRAQASQIRPRRWTQA
jgi:hypothetical protein